MVCCDEGTFGHDLPLSLKLASHFLFIFSTDAQCPSVLQNDRSCFAYGRSGRSGDQEALSFYFQTALSESTGLSSVLLLENQDKAEGIRFLEQYDPRITYTVCFGDSHNDLKMFEYCDEGYCMRHSPDALKALANAIIDLKGEFTRFVSHASGFKSLSFIYIA